MDKAEQTCPEENQDQIGDVKTSTNSEMTLNSIPQKKTITSLILTIFSVFTYSLLFTLIYYSYGKGMAISAIIPVIVVGWLYGRVPGICAGVLSYPINIFMYVLFGVSWLEGMMLGGGCIPGTIGLILIGAAIGHMSSLSIQLKKHRDKLDELVKRKTEELQASNTKLKETKEHLDNLIESSVDCIMVSDKTGYITKVNRYFLDLLGYSEEEAIGKHVMDCTPMVEEGTYECTTGEMLKIGKEFIDDANTMISILLDEGKVINWETYYFRKDKKVVPIEQNIVCLYNEEGERTGAVAIIRDITERKKAEREIREGKEFMEKIIQGSKDGIVICDEMGSVISANEAMVQILGMNKEELIGKHSSELIIDDPSEREKVLEKMGELFEKDYTSYETKYKRKDGHHVDIECYTSIIKDDNGNVIAGISIERDITEKKKMKQQLLQSDKLKSLGELSGGVAHDFNNVLAAILGRVQLLKMQFKSPPGKQEKRKSMLDLLKSLDIIERASLDGAETVRRIQEFSRKRVDDKEFTQIDINELVDNALEFTSVRWKNDAESKGITITIQKELSPLPPTSGSASEVREVFTNLIHNAIDAMPKGGRIKIKTFKENGHISIKVEDTGVGISEVIRNRIFDPFFTTKGVQSTGLGMSVSYGIINRHGGTIRVDSTEGKGSTFSITLPISDNISVEEDKTKPIPEEKRKSTS